MKLLKRFMKYYKPHTRLFVLDMLAALTVALLAVVYPMVTRTMLNTLMPERRYQEIVWAGLGLLLICTPSPVALTGITEYLLHIA